MKAGDCVPGLLTLSRKFLEIARGSEELINISGYVPASLLFHFLERFCF